MSGNRRRRLNPYHLKVHVALGLDQLGPTQAPSIGQMVYRAKDCTGKKHSISSRAKASTNRRKVKITLAPVRGANDAAD